MPIAVGNLNLASAGRPRPHDSRRAWLTRCAAPTSTVPHHWLCSRLQHVETPTHRGPPLPQALDLDHSLSPALPHSTQNPRSPELRPRSFLGACEDGAGRGDQGEPVWVSRASDRAALCRAPAGPAPHSWFPRLLDAATSARCRAPWWWQAAWAGLPCMSWCAWAQRSSLERLSAWRPTRPPSRCGAARVCPALASGR